MKLYELQNTFDEMTAQLKELDNCVSPDKNSEQYKMLWDDRVEIKGRISKLQKSGKNEECLIQSCKGNEECLPHCPCDCHVPKSLSESLIRLTKTELINLIIKIQLKAQDEIWTHHELGDNWGMTFEQSKKVNELATDIHNTAYQEIIKTIKNYIKNI